MVCVRSPMSRVVKVLWAAAKKRKAVSSEAAQDQAWADAHGGAGKHLAA